MKDHLAPEEVARREEAFFDACVAGEYSFYGRHAERALGTPAGVLRLASLLFGIDEADMAFLMTCRQEDIVRLLKLVQAESRAGKE